MKIYYEIFIIYCLITIINSLCELEDGEEEPSRIREKKDCIQRSISDEETRNGGYRCCFMRQKVDSISFKGNIYSCLLVTSEQYDNIKNLIKAKEKETGVEDVKINCKSSYLQFGLIILLLLLFEN